MTVLAPLSGSPESVRLLADRLAVTGERLTAMSTVLARLRGGAVWDGPAGEAFGTRVGAVPGALDAAGRRHLGAVGPVRALADALEAAQADTARAQREHTAAQERYVSLENRAWSLVSQGVGEADPLLLAVRRHQQGEAETMERCRRQHAVALAALAEADRRCAHALRALADDGLADPWTYRALSSTAGTGHDVGTLGLLTPLAPELGPVALVGDGVGTAGDLALLVGYGEGSWGAVAASAACTATGFAGRALATGAGAGARLGADGVEVLGRLSSRERVLAGSVAEARRRVAAVRRTFDVPAPRATPSALLGGPPVRPPRVGPVARVRGGLATGRARVRAALDRRFLDEWRLATANGTRGMYASGVTLQAAAAAGQKAADRSTGSHDSPRRGREVP